MAQTTSAATVDSPRILDYTVVSVGDKGKVETVAVQKVPLSF